MDKCSKPSCQATATYAKTKEKKEKHTRTGTLDDSTNASCIMYTL